MHAQLFPQECITDSLESLLAGRSRAGVAIYLALLGMLGAALLLLPLLRVGVAVQAPGIVRPVMEKQEVRARTAGFAEEVAARSGRRVRRGELLVRLSGAPLQLREERLRERRELATARLHDLRRLTRAPGVPALDPASLGTADYRHALSQLVGELDDLARREAHAARELDRALALAQRQLAPGREVEERELELARLRAERTRRLDGARGAWQRDLSELEATLRSLELDGREVAQEAALFRVQAPVDGTLEEVASLAPGSYVQAGDRLAVISPAGRLVAEVYVPPRDVGLVRVGTRARLLVDAFPYTDWGFLTGEVRAISSDYLLVGDSPAFRVVVALDGTQLRLPNGARGELRKGMTLRARFMVAERTLWQLLRDDVNDWINPIGPA